MTNVNVTLTPEEAHLLRCALNQYRGWLGRRIMRFRKESKIVHANGYDSARVEAGRIIEKLIDAEQRRVELEMVKGKLTHAELYPPKAA